MYDENKNVLGETEGRMKTSSRETFNLLQHGRDSRLYLNIYIYTYI